MKQSSFFPKLNTKAYREYGGETRQGKRKIARPFSSKLPLHVVFRALKAKGELSLLNARHKRSVERTLENCAKRYQIKIYQVQNVGNHIHLILQTKTRTHHEARIQLANFLRQFAGMVAMQVTKAKKGKALNGRFWDELVYSRLVTWGRDFENLKNYLVKNLFEAQGLWNRKKYPDWVLMTISADTS